MKTKTIYYALWDMQCNRQMATGLNATSKEEVKKGLWSYFEPDREEVFQTDDIDLIDLQLLLDVGEFLLMESEEPFEELD